MFELTAKEIKMIDEIEADKNAADQTLKISLTYHSNCMNEHHKRSKDWWELLREKHGFDPNEGYKVKRLNASVYISKIEDKEERL